MDKYFKKISIDGDTFFIFTNMPCSLDKFNDVSTDYFNVSLCNGKEVYSGKVFIADILKMSSDVDIEEGSFYNTLRHCLSHVRSNSQFTYHIEEGDDSSIKFIWKQILDEEMKFQLGSMLLTREGNPELKTLDIFSFLSQKLNELDDEVTHLSNKNKNLEVEKSEMTKRLDGYVHTKECLEKDLFTKFSLVLNEKKARIRELKLKVDEGCDNNERNENQKKREESGGDTDTDEEIKKDNERTIEINSKKITKEKDNKLGIILDASISDDKDDLPKKNRKRVRTNKTKAPVQSILPRTTSLLRPPKQPSPPKVSEEIKPKEIPEEEDLLDQLMF